jgi:tetratricopeptide (TPR) repeat protein
MDNRLEEARAHIKESLNREPKSFQNYYVMALIELRTQNFEAALASLETAKAHLSSDSEPALLPQIKIEWAQSSALRGLRRYEEADDLLEKIIRKTIENLGENHFFLGDLYLEQAWVRSDRRGYGQAQKLLRKTFRIWKQHYEENHPKMLDAYIAMGLAQVEGDLAEEAIETLQKAQSINEILGNTEQRKLEIQFILALAYADRDRYLDRAIELAGRTLYELRQSDLKLPYLEVRIQRWLEAI